MYFHAHMHFQQSKRQLQLGYNGTQFPYIPLHAHMYFQHLDCHCSKAMIMSGTKPQFWYTYSYMHICVFSILKLPLQQGRISGWSCLVQESIFQCWEWTLQPSLIFLPWHHPIRLERGGAHSQPQLCVYVYVCVCMYVCVTWHHPIRLERGGAHSQPQLCVYVYVCVCMCMYVYVCVWHDTILPAKREEAPIHSHNSVCVFCVCVYVCVWFDIVPSK